MYTPHHLLTTLQSQISLANRSWPTVWVCYWPPLVFRFLVWWCIATSLKKDKRVEVRAYVILVHLRACTFLGATHFDLTGSEFVGYQSNLSSHSIGSDVSRSEFEFALEDDEDVDNGMVAGNAAQESGGGSDTYTLDDYASVDDYGGESNYSGEMRTFPSKGYEHID